MANSSLDGGAAPAVAKGLPPTLGPAPHARPAAEVAAELSVDPAVGLALAEVEARREAHGANELASRPPEPWWRRLAAQFQALVIWILIAAAVIAGAMGEWIDTAAILAIVVLNGLIGFFQEERAERALAALGKLSAPLAKVLRAGQLAQLPARELVPGDVLELEAGDNVPADARLVVAFGLSAGEAALTGESVPVAKDAIQLAAPETPLADRHNMVYLGTVITAGKATAVVTATGMATELGQIAGLLEQQPREPTPLQRRLEELGRLLVFVCLGLVGTIFVLELVRGGELLEVLLVSVSLAVAAVPEGLPAVVTLALAIGLKRMVERNALIRKLPSVETLGSVTVICSDKTGTLTRNEMTVRRVAAGGRVYDVSGAGYNPQGTIEPRAPGKGSPLAAAPTADPTSAGDLRRLAEIAAGCNHAQLVPPAAPGGGWQIIGDPTEGALVVLARKLGLTDPWDGGRLVHELPFDSDRKLMSVVVGWTTGQRRMWTKGAPEAVLARATGEWCDGQVVPLSPERRHELSDLNRSLAGEALRVLALAYRDLPPGIAGEPSEEDLVLAGLVGMIDPPRDEVRQAVELCHTAGIRPVMITGDHPDTALAIARELKIADAQTGVLPGAELDKLSDEELRAVVPQTAVYARVSAAHKLRVIEAWKARGQVVAMTGDGVNDAPAVKAADIGIAMGITGTDVTKEASDMVLLDDNFTSIVSAVEEGRGIFENIQKFVHYLLACNASEVAFMFFASLVGWPAPLLAIQILWINLVTDGLPALALGLEPPERDIMRRPPRPPREAVITLRRGILILTHGSLLALAAGLGFAQVYDASAPDGLTQGRTVAFAVMALGQLAFSFACRSHGQTLFALGPFTNPWLFVAIAVSALLQVGMMSWSVGQRILGTSPGCWVHAPLILVLALAPVTVVEVAKLVRAGWQALAAPRADRRGAA